MKKVWVDLMGMPITVEILDPHVTDQDFQKIYNYFNYVDQKFSTYKEDSEITKINTGKLTLPDSSEDMQTIFNLSEKTKRETDGYFEIYYKGKYDPSGVVKGWSIFEASKQLLKSGFNNFYIDAGGDIQAQGVNKDGQKWKVGIKNPFNREKIVKVIFVSDEGVATSGNYLRGQHIYNPKTNRQIEDVVSITVVGPDILEADRFATAAFAMGKYGIQFIEKLDGFEGYMIDKNGIATFTSNFERLTIA